MSEPFHTDPDSTGPEDALVFERPPLLGDPVINANRLPKPGWYWRPMNPPKAEYATCDRGPFETRGQAVADAQLGW